MNAIERLQAQLERGLITQQEHDDAMRQFDPTGWDDENLDMMMVYFRRNLNDSDWFRLMAVIGYVHTDLHNLAKNLEPWTGTDSSEGRWFYDGEMLRQWVEV